MNFLSDFLVNIMYVATFIYVGEECFGYLRRCCRYEKVVFLIAVFMTTIIFQLDYFGIKVIAFVGCLFITLITFFREKTLILTLFYLGYSLAISQVSELMDVLWLGIVRVFNIGVTTNINDVLTMAFVAICIYLIGQYYKKNYPGQLRKIGAGYWVFLVLVLLFDSAVVLSLGDFVEYELQATRKYIFEVAYLFVVVGILIQLVLLINTLVARNIHKENELQAKRFLENQKEHYLYLEKRELETKKFRHDIRNHLTLLNSFIYNKEYDEVEKYLNSLNEKVNDFGNHISVNNGIADAVFNKFYSDAKEQGIELEVNGHFPMECYISAYDICTILSNLLSNAILAERQCDGKAVLVDVRYTDEEIFLIIENDYVHDLKEVDGVFQTTKENELGHGLGLSNVKECVERCGGFMSISTENHRFKVMLSMMNVKEEQA